MNAASSTRKAPADARRKVALKNWPPTYLSMQSIAPTEIPIATPRARNVERNLEVARPILVTGLDRTDSSTPLTLSFPYEEYAPMIAMRGMNIPIIVAKKEDAMLTD